MKGWISKDKHTMPTGRRAFAEPVTDTADSRPKLVQPYGTSGNTAGQTGYLDKASQDYRAGLRESPTTPENPVVTAKRDKRLGRNETTGEQPASPPHETGKNNPPVTTRGGLGAVTAERIGWVNGKFVAPSYPNANRELVTDGGPSSIQRTDRDMLGGKFVPKPGQK